MALTRLGWDVFTSPSTSRLTNSSWITGKVRGGDHKVVLDELCRRFNAEVEKITQAHSWGWAYRAVRGAAVISEHAAGTAVDLNAPRHPLGKSGTFSGSQVSKIHAILSDLGGVVRWGGDYAGRKDEMHFELQGGNVAVGKVADRIRGNVKPATPSKPKPKPSGKGWPAKPLPVTSKHTKASDAAWRELMAAIGYKDKDLTTNIQRWLSKLRDPRTGKGYYTGIIEKDHGRASVFGPMLVEALQKKLYDTSGPGGKPAHIYYGTADGSRGSTTIKAEIAYLNLPANRGV